jgi:hypothetical protein
LSLQLGCNADDKLQHCPMSFAALIPKSMRCF